jgi:hypothetical protein
VTANQFLLIRAKRDERHAASKRTCLSSATATSASNITTLASLPNERILQIWLRDDSCVKVSKSLLMEVPYFQDLFSRNWEPSEYRLFAYQPDAMKILMAILHHKLHRLPGFLSTTQLFHLATVCDKCNVTDLVLPHVDSRMWVTRLWKDGKPCDMSWEQWLWILHVFPTTTTEKGPQRERVLDVLSAGAILYEDCWFFKVGGSCGEISELRSPANLPPLESKISDSVLEGNTNRLKETIKERRRELWGSFLERCQRHYGVTGEMTVFLHDAESELPSDTSFTGKLKSLLKQRPLPMGLETIIQDTLEEYEA